MVGVTPGLRKIYLLSVTLFMLAGWTALGVGTYFISTPFMRREAVLTPTPIWVAIGIGISMAASSIIGFIVAFSRHKARTKIAIFIALISVIVVATLCLGAYVWFQTLNVRTLYSDRWQGWQDALKDAFQSNDKCCGYKSTIDSPAFSDTCTKEVVFNGLLSPCEDKILQYVNTYLRNIYTTLFLYTAVDVLTMLAALMLDQTLKDQFRYEKSVAKMINLHNISMHQEQSQLLEPQMQMQMQTHIQNHMNIAAPRRSLLPNTSMHNYSVIHGQHQ